jgi:hypothetical protein
MKYTQSELDHAVKLAVIDAEHSGYMRWFAESKRIFTSIIGSDT